MFTSKLPAGRLFAPRRMKARLTRESHKEIAATGKAPIYLRLTYQGRVTYLATGVYLLAREWEQKTQAVKGREEVHDAARASLRLWVGEAEALAQQHRKTPGMSVAKYKALLLGKDTQPLTLLAVADAFYQNKARPELHKAFATLRSYRSRRATLEVYLAGLKQLELLASAVTLPWLRAMERWCYAQQDYAVSTARKHLGYVQEVLDYAAHEGWLTTNPVSNYRAEVEAAPAEPAYLTEAQVQQLAAARPASRAQQRAVDAWLFCCYTGLSYVDYLRFEPADVCVDAAGRRWIRLNRQKTGAAVSIPVLPETAALLERCGGQVPKVEISTLRRHLKCVATELDLRPHPNPALARHTASHRFRNLYGFTDEEAAAICGHTKQVMNSNYSRKREEGLTLALDRLGIAAPAVAAPPAPTLLEQLRAALENPATAELLRAGLSDLLP